LINTWRFWPGLHGDHAPVMLVRERDAEAGVQRRFGRGHDAYWYFRDSFFDLLVPTPGRLLRSVVVKVESHSDDRVGAAGSFQIVEENLAQTTGSARFGDIVVGSTFVAVWWWIVGVPEDARPPE